MTGTGNRPLRLARCGGVVALACLLAVAASACGGNANDSAAKHNGDPLTAPAALGDGTVHATAGGYAALAMTATSPRGRALAALQAAIVLGPSDSGGAQPFLRLATQLSGNDTSVHSGAAFLLARDLLPSDPKAARELLKPIVKSQGPMQPYLRAAYASALGATGDSGGASKQWKQLLDADPVPGELAVQAYRALASSSKGDDRLTWLKKLSAATGAPADRLQFGIAAKDDGDKKTFETELRAVIQDDPGSHEAVLALQALHAAHIAVDPGDEGLVDYRHSDFDAAEAVLKPSVAAPGASPEQRTFRLYYLAATYEAEAKTDEAIATYDRAASTGAKSPYIHRAKYWAAEVMASNGDSKDASARYAALAKEGPKGEFTAEAAFEAGYLLLKAGDPAAALQTWEQVGSSEPKVLYWQGRAAVAAGFPDKAAAAFKAAAKVGPFDFYGIEAQAVLTGTKATASYRERAIPADVDWTAVSNWLTTRKGPGTIPEPATAAAQLAGLGLREQARNALNAAANDADAWQLLGLIREAREAGLFRASSTLTQQLVNRLGLTDAQLPRQVLQLEYPVTYVSQLQAVAKADGIDPLFLAATIYQESLWNPDAGSSAGAIGLMQLIASTGAQVGAGAGLQNVSAADLFQPELNLELGAAFLGDQLKTFGDPALALAAYNAGPGNAARWEAEWDGADAATLVDIMDYPETAGYVESIFEWYASYQAAYGNGS